MSDETKREHDLVMVWKRELLMPHEERYCRVRVMEAPENGGRSWEGVGKQNWDGVSWAGTAPCEWLLTDGEAEKMAKYAIDQAERLLTRAAELISAARRSGYEGESKRTMTVHGMMSVMREEIQK